MIELEEIVDAELEAWHVPENKITIRDLLLRTALAVADRMLDPAEVGRQIGQLAAERDHARAERDQELCRRQQEPCLRCAHVDQFIETLEQERDEARRKNANLVAENLRLVVEMDDMTQTIQDQAEIIERLEARR